MARKKRRIGSSGAESGVDGASITGGFSYSSDSVDSHPPVHAPLEQPLPPRLRDPVHALLAAFEQPVPIRLSLTCSSELEPEKFWLITTHLAEGGGWGFGVDITAPIPDLLVSIADGIQEHIAEQAQTWAQARPPCPGHRHPAVARVIDGTAWWTCPARQTRLKPIAP